MTISGSATTAAPSGIAFANPMEPQTLNLYVYTADNPLTFVDPFGLQLVLSCTFGEDTTSALPNGVKVTGHSSCTINRNGKGDEPNSWLPEVSRSQFPVKDYHYDNPACNSSILAKAGIDAQGEINTAQAYIQGVGAGINAGAGPYANQFLRFMGGMLGYAAAVHTGGPNDVKDLPGHSRSDNNDVAAGNVSYGITCPYGKGFCVFAAGVAQSIIGLSPNFNGKLTTGYDTPSDTQQIRIGQAMRARGCRE